MITENTLNLLEFSKLLKLVSGAAHSNDSKKAVLSIHPLRKRHDIETRLTLIKEIRTLSQEGNPLKFAPFADISDLIKRLRPDGAVLEAAELSAFISVLENAKEISSHVMQRESFPLLTGLTGQMTGQPAVLNVLKKSIDSEGNILDSASSALSELRRHIRRNEAVIQKKLEEMMRDNRIAVFLQDDFITKRAGRWVIPVRMDSKGQVAGVVHDVSKSGETAFIEPLGILNLSNELENLIAEEKAEEIRILRDLSSRIRDKADEIDKEHRVLIYLDMLNCIANFADRMKMEIPQINESGIIKLSRAGHPLLTIALQKTDRDIQVVPLDVQLGGDNNVMVITGSNAGGKTIAIKTIGLLLIMALSGMPVPADSSSSFPLVDNVLIDIGDEQSIENSLSTFSAHISNISGILGKACRNTLILIDELGTGTDPEEGAALACAVLNEIQKSGALVFATTHLADIKGFVFRTEGMQNASMEFDQKTLTPLYRLRIGEPGQSHALIIAKKYGLPDNVINSARDMLGGLKVQFDNLISDLNEKRAGYEKAIEGLAKQHKDIEEKQRELEQKISDAESKGRKILSDAYKEASDILINTKRQMNAWLDEIKKIEKSKIREKIKQVEQAQRSVDEKAKQYDKDAGETPKIENIKKGDVVYVRSLGFDAIVREIIAKHNRIRVSAGGMEIEIPLSDAGVKRGRALQLSREGNLKDESPDKVVESRINLIGLRVDEAISRLEPFLNHAALAGFDEVTIIHGIGKGLLAKAVHEHLESHPLVRKFRRGEQSEGGYGVTVVTLT
ncbi:MAG: endonuclease MutS2 [Nitrospirota bacterium]